MFFLLIINYCFLITAVKQIFIPAAQFAILIKTTPKEEKVKIETHPETTRAKISYCLMQFKAIQSFLCFLLIKSFFHFFLIK